MNSTMFFRLISACFILAGLSAVGWSFLLFRKAKQTLSWLHTEGKVLSARIIKSKDSEGEKQYKANIRYQYSVNNVLYTSDVCWPESSTVTYSGLLAGRASKIIEKYSAGKEISVFFNPEEHADAVLEPGRWERPVLWIGLILIVGGLLFYIAQASLSKSG